MTEDELKAIFTGAGVEISKDEEVEDGKAVILPTDKFDSSKNNRGFGFVYVPEAEFDKATALNGTPAGDRTLVVNEAREKKDRDEYRGGGRGQGGFSNNRSFSRDRY